MAGGRGRICVVCFFFVVAHGRDLAHRPTECIVVDIFAFLVAVFDFGSSKKISYYNELKLYNFLSKLIMLMIINNNHQVKLTHHFGAVVRTITQAPSSRRFAPVAA